MDSDVNFIGEPVNTDHLKSCSATVRSLGDAMGCLTMIIYSFLKVRSGQELWHELSTVSLLMVFDLGHLSVSLSFIGH